MTLYLDIEYNNDARCVLRSNHDCSGPITAYAESIKSLPQGPLIFRFCEKHEICIPLWMRKLSAEEMIIIDIMNT